MRGNPEINPEFLVILEEFIHKSDSLGFSIPAAHITVLLVGSRAKNCARFDSDWDVLIIHPDSPSFDIRRYLCVDGYAYKGFKLDIILANPNDWINSKSDFIVDARMCAKELFVMEPDGILWGRTIPAPTTAPKPD